MSAKAAPASALRAVLSPATMAGLVPAGLLLVTLHALPLLRLAANRLVAGEPVYASALTHPAIALAAALPLAGLALLMMAPRRSGGLVALLLFCVSWAVLLLGLGAQASLLVEGRPPAARVGLGSGFWVASVCLGALMGAGIARARQHGLGLLASVAGLGFLILAWRGGGLDHLSLAVEYAGRRGAVNEAIAEHLLLSAGALVLAVAAAIILSLWRTGQGVVGLLVSGVQVIPAVALLGGLVALVSGLLRLVPALRDLGISALGPWPALVGIAAYLLLPLWRGIGTALRSADPAALDAAEALGLTKAQVLRRVRLPLGAPVLVGALRVAAVQSLGLATLGALIGAGGLGRIVFDGMAQFAPDLILLGAIPIVALSLAAERVLSALEAWCRARWRA